MINTNAIYQIAPHHRLQWEPMQTVYVVLFPEGMVKLNMSGGEILKRLDGSRTVLDIIADCQQAFPEASGLEEDIIAMLELALNKGWIKEKT